MWQNFCCHQLKRWKVRHRVCWWKVRSSHKRFHNLPPWTVPYRSIDDAGRIFLLSEHPTIHHVVKANPDWCRVEPRAKCTKTQCIGLTHKVHRMKGWAFWQTISHAVFSQRLSASWLFGTCKQRIQGSQDRIIATRNSKSHPFFEVRGKHSSEARWDLLPRQRQLNFDSIYDFKGCRQKNHMEEEKKDRKTLLQELCKQLFLTLTKADGLQKWRKETLFSETSKEMIHASRNVEDFELAMSIVRKNSLLSLYEILNEGLFTVIAVPTLVPSEQGRKLNKERLDVLTIHLFTNKRRHTEGIAVVVQIGNSHSIRPKHR